ncbi:protein OBERON 4 [Senna tora]|uniref:Protein OBERON 4 n=1 Tax=Senna tora TaxID=362788 RepID=A0A835CA14_9FABA|nr:protein OBERON 4 [Senna tora]
MKRLRSSDDLHSYGDKNVCKDSNLNRSSSSSHRSFYYKPDNVRKGLPSSSSSASRYDRDRTVDEEREGSRLVRKRSDHDFESFDRRKGFDRYRDSADGRGYRSESFCGSRRDFPKRFRSERDRSRREGSVSSWRRFGGGLKDFEENRVVRSPKGLRDVKSPTWSKDSESEQSKMRSPPRGSRDATSKSKSPSWSKDSESEQSKSEQSKSVEVKKTEELQVESRSSSEMEEGELEPEPMPETEPETAPKVAHANGKEVQTENQLNDTDTTVPDRSEESNKEETKPNGDTNSGEKNVGKEDDKQPDVLNDPNDKMHENKKEIRTVDRDDNKEEESLKVDTEFKEETKEGADLEKPLFYKEEHEQDKGVDLVTRADSDKPEPNEEVSTGNEVHKTDGETEMDTVTNNVKDKGKSVSVAPSDVVHSSDDGMWNDRGLRDLATCSDDPMEGPSTRGFELFSRSPVRKVEKTDPSGLNKQKDGSLSMEELDLSLSLPNVLLPIGAQETTPVPGSPSQARSVQSLSTTFRTNSEGFTASMSFSGSQSFYHNPSCSLTQNSLDFEQSVGSRPLFQGIDQVSHGGWQGQSQNDPKQKEIPLCQGTMMNGNGTFGQSQATWGILDGQAVKGQHSRLIEGSSKMASGLDRQLSFHKQLSGQSRRHDDVRSPSQSVGSHDIGSSYSFDKKREMRDRSSGNLHRTASQKEQEQFQMGGIEFVETIIARIVSEPVHTMAKKFHEMTGQSVACLKESIREIMLNADKRGQVLAFQKVLQSRSDITLEVLQKSHRLQLEILVSLKTGLVNFLQLDNTISSSDLAEIFLNLRCRNLLCRSQLPVDECDCKVCVQKDGFCRDCMCLVCLKFDNASNTCSWVGCDVCLHWCHTDCGLRESYIRNGHSATGAQGVTEMQFHCIACDHPSEMFGFVKEVFLNFAKDWSVEAFCKELEYVKRIFSASKDMRGRQLHEIADQMLLRLINKSNLKDVYSHIMSFLADGDSSKVATTQNFSGKEIIKEKKGVAGPSQEAAWMKSVYSEKMPLLERPANILPSYDRNDKRTPAQELQMNVQKDFCFDELESIVKIKQAEAKMFQTRADDARREAEGLKRIALAKNEKIEEEYASRLSKLQLAEAEEMRKQKFEELQALERAHLEYFNMKRRMEVDIKDLLLKMEATKRSLAM